MAWKRLHFLPVIVSAWFPVTFLITYLTATLSGHVPFYFPYISDTGTFVPESCIFGQLLNSGLLLMVLVMYIRYRQIKKIHQRLNLESMNVLNKCGYFVGLLGVLGIDIVANFQISNVFIVHLIGAMSGFGMGATYLIMQTAMSFKLYPMIGSRWILIVRFVMMSITTICFLLSVIFGIVAFYMFKGEDKQKWSENDGGWQYHLVSTFSEWIMAIGMMAFILTFTPEFRELTLSEPELSFTENYTLNELSVA